MANWGFKSNADGVGKFQLEHFGAVAEYVPGHERVLEAEYVPGAVLPPPTVSKDTHRVQVQANGDLLPRFHSVNNLGSPNQRWNRIYLVNSPLVSSDEQLESEVEPLRYGLDEVMQLRPKSYAQEVGEEVVTGQIGLLAQELREVIPEVVSKPGTEDEVLDVC